MCLYDYWCVSIDGEKVPLEQYRGKVLLIVNTASKCGFTPQYKGLESLYREYRQAGLVVLGFPCDQFLRQELPVEEEIQQFCVTNYEISFPLFAKIKVRGKDADGLFVRLQDAAPGWFATKSIKWNFTKFLVNRDGSTVMRFAPATYPNQLRRHIERFLQLDA